MAGELEGVVRGVLAALDRLDMASIGELLAPEAQGVDEISRRWMRGREEVGAYLRQLEGAVQDVRSELRDVHEVVWGDTGMVTAWLEQDYTLEGQRQHISAPTTVVLHQEDGRWRVVLLHSVPLPESPDT